MTGNVIIADANIEAPSISDWIEEKPEEIVDGDVLIARELSKMINAERYEDSLQGVTEKIKKETIDALLEKINKGKLQTDNLSDDEYEWLNGHPNIYNFWKKANPFSKENFEQINKILTENDPDIMMSKVLSEEL